jgi:pimeloyl-ACP methyl ester carboxylesterase
MEDPPIFLTEGALYTRVAFALTLKVLPFDQRVERLMKPTNMPREAAVIRAENYGNMSEGVVAELAKGGPIYRAEDVLPKVSCPTLVILGNPTIDAVVEWSDRTRLRRLLKGSRILDWPEVGHNIHRDTPERFVTAVSDFLQTLS